MLFYLRESNNFFEKESIVKSFHPYYNAFIAELLFHLSMPAKRFVRFGLVYNMSLFITAGDLECSNDNLASTK